MKRLWLIVPGVAFVALLTVAVMRQGGELKVGDAAPAFSAPALSGEGSSSLSDLKGKPVVLNFWASWCEPCKDEAELFKEAAERYQGRAHFVGINIRDARSDALAFVEDYELDYLQLRDEALAVYDDYGLTGQPETFFIDHDGKLIEHVAGPVEADTLYSVMDLLVARGA